MNTINSFTYDYNHKSPYNKFKVTNYLELVPEHFSKVIILRNRAELADYHHTDMYNYFDKAKYKTDGEWNNYGYGPRFYVPYLAVLRSQKWKNEHLFESSYNTFPSVVPDPDIEELIDLAIDLEKYREFMNSHEFYKVDSREYSEDYNGDEVYVVYTEKLSDWNKKKLAPYCQCDYHRFSYWNPLKFLYNTKLCGCICEFDNRTPPQEVIDSTRMVHDEAMKKEINIKNQKSIINKKRKLKTE